MPESDELPAPDINRDRIFTAALLDGQYAIAGGDGGFTVFLTIFCCQRLCLRQLANANGVFPSNRAAVVVALKADELLVVEVAVNKSALFSAVLAVWKLSSALFSVP